ncbi:MAG: hypothetical protein ACRDVF_17900 [Microbacterium sp.]|uniref:hypothetical protein n=1 Tax=Microbacterium sp. TaxID=51671 RepID=UPI003D6E4F24
MADATGHVFIFLFQIPGAQEPDEYAVRAYEDDALQDFSLGGPDPSGVFEADFQREARSFPAAVLSALHDLERVFPKAVILRVEPDDLVTIAAIAERVGRSHESIRLLARNERGPGGFPPPAGRLDAKTQVWRWSDAAPWLREHVGEIQGGEHAAFVAALNDILDLRRNTPDAIDESETAQELADLLPEELSKAM